ncbi:hypothetical protein MAPG_06168 [Magnaporthiopsis poae ATCC 64411]|uniref:Uncharacterized protein n=1 Tax=Magnaporthiopsis poae (strain ATCC 64411 / 73-15) TaxID=644358 RepID=A0A0C4E1B1_MAGP6|nr:hypothetical protein MAPG_06168 [Magnaporthiopsis poae ATCC 64411]
MFEQMGHQRHAVGLWPRPSHDTPRRPNEWLYDPWDVPSATIQVVLAPRDAPADAASGPLGLWKRSGL